jgi:signal transduction histidine kinase
VTPAPLMPSERVNIEWIERAERQAILPLRVSMLLLTALIWQWEHDWALPTTSVFILFFGYSATLVLAAYCLLFSRLERHQVVPFSLSSLIIDGIFVAGMFHLDRALSDPGEISSEYFIFFFLLVLRGYAVLQRSRDILIMNALVLAVFVSLFLVHQPTESLGAISPVAMRDLSVQTALIVLVMGLSWFLLGTLNRQRSELIAVQERLLRSENLATLGEIVAGVAHEINNPVGIISAYADFLLKKAGDREELVEDFQAIRSEARRCQQIVEQLLSFASPSAAEPRPVDLALINDEVLRFLFLDKKSSLIDVQTLIEPDLPLIEGDSVQLKQALLNIHMNARHAMGDQGRIRVEMRLDPTDRRRLRMRIHDSGSGIREEVLGRLFEPFFTSKEGGSGLGLAITRRIIESHGGLIEASNDPEGGAVFTITLPVARRR